MEQDKKYMVYINDNCATSGCYANDDFLVEFNSVGLKVTEAELKAIVPILVDNGLYVEISRIAGQI